MYVCMYVRVRMYVCMYVLMHVWVCVCVCVCICMYMYMVPYLCLFMCRSTCTCRMCVSMCMCMCTHIRIAWLWPPPCFTMFPITPKKYGPAQSQFKAIRRGFAASYWGIATARAAVCGKALVNSNPQ